MIIYCVEEPSSRFGANLTSVEVALAVALPIAIICFVVVVAYTLCGRRKRVHTGLRVDESVDDPDHPILGVNSIRDMIEMTTSGSGSGRIYTFPHPPP